MYVFDYKYVTGFVKHRVTHRQTVVCFAFNRHCLPSFCLQPETIWHKIGTWFGSQDIDFIEDPDFSEAYLLRGKDEAAIRMLFTAEVLAFYRTRLGLCTEVAGNHLIVYRPQEVVPSESIEQYISEAMAILALLRPSPKAA